MSIVRFDQTRTSIWEVLMEHMMYECGKKSDGAVHMLDGGWMEIREDLSFACVNRMMKKDSRCCILDCSEELSLDEMAELEEQWMEMESEEPEGAPGDRQVIYYLVNLDSRIPEQEACLTRLRESLEQNEGEACERYFWDISVIETILQELPQIREQYVSYPEYAGARERLFTDEQRSCLSTLGRYLEKCFMEDRFSKMEQAGSVTDEKVALQKVFVDLEAFREQGNRNGRPGMFVDEMIRLGNHVNRYVKTFRKEEHLVKRDYLLLGTAGQGKSTVCQYLIQIYRAAWLEQNSAHGSRKEVGSFQQEYEKSQCTKVQCRRIPIHIVVKEYAAWLQKQAEQGEALDVLLYMREQIRRKTGEEIRLEILRELLAKLSWIFVFDGLDEVPSSSNRERLTGEIRDFRDGELRRANCDGVVICTSRPQGNLEGLVDAFFLRLRLADFSQERCLIYLDRLMEQMSSSSEEKARFMEVLGESAGDPVVSHLMKSPLQATIVAILVKTGGKPPRDRYNLFDTYYQTMKNREKQKDTLESLHDTLDWMDDIHYRLALRLQKESESDRNPSAAITEEPFLQLIREYLEEMDDEIDAEELGRTFFHILTRRLCFITDVNTEGEYMFSIRSMQEFLAANGIVRQREQELITELNRIAPSAYWRNVFLFALGYMNKNMKHLEPEVCRICGKLNGEDCTPAQYSLEKISCAGSLLALDILIEGIYKGAVKIEKKYCSLFFQIKNPAEAVMDELREYSRLSAEKKEYLRREYILPQLKTEKENLTLWYLLSMSEGMDEVLEHVKQMKLSAAQQREVLWFLREKFSLWDSDAAEAIGKCLAELLEQTEGDMRISYEDACQVLCHAKPAVDSKAFALICKALLQEIDFRRRKIRMRGAAMKYLPDFWGRFEEILLKLNNGRTALDLAEVLTFQWRAFAVEKGEREVLEEAKIWFEQTGLDIEAVFLDLLLYPDAAHAGIYVDRLWKETIDERRRWLKVHSNQSGILYGVVRKYTLSAWAEMEWEQALGALCLDYEQNNQKLRAAYRQRDWDEFWKWTGMVGANGSGRNLGIRLYLEEQEKAEDQIPQMNEEELAHLLFVTAVNLQDHDLEEDEQQIMKAAYEEYLRRDWEIPWVNIWARRIALYLLNEKEAAELVNASDQYEAFVQKEEALYLHGEKAVTGKSVENLWESIIWMLEAVRKDHPIFRVIPSTLVSAPKTEGSLPAGKYRQLLRFSCVEPLRELGRLLFLMRVPDWNPEETEELGEQVTAYLKRTGIKDCALFLKLGETYDVKRSPVDAVYLSMYQYLLEADMQTGQRRKYLKRLCGLAYQKIQA
ncbi:MAG: hypothetical protein KH452_03220 [Clostridiales bacterium]|nr:hypothetical protein [Clostridiales bacterium]